MITSISEKLPGKPDGLEDMGTIVKAGERCVGCSARPNVDHRKFSMRTCNGWLSNDSSDDALERGEFVDQDSKHRMPWKDFLSKFRQPKHSVWN